MEARLVCPRHLENMLAKLWQLIAYPSIIVWL